MYTVFTINEKVDFERFDTFESAHDYCVEDASPMMLIFEGMSMNDFFYHRFTKPLALYINGNRYSVTEYISQQNNEGDPLISEVEVELLTGKYIVKKYKSTTIKVSHIQTNQFVKAHPILRQINTELKLNIDLSTPSGNYQKNTRQLGDEVIKALRARGY